MRNYYHSIKLHVVKLMKTVLEFYAPILLVSYLIGGGAIDALVSVHMLIFFYLKTILI